MCNETIIRTYKGKKEQAIEAFRIDAAELGTQNCFPIAQTWVQGSYGCGHFLFALLLCVLVIGILVFIYMLIVPPEGTLTVTYEIRSVSIEGKVCPQCAERVKSAAKICHFCRHKFE